jgi:hypothetical protein
LRHCFWRVCVTGCDVESFYEFFYERIEHGYSEGCLRRSVAKNV